MRVKNLAMDAMAKDLKGLGKTVKISGSESSGTDVAAGRDRVELRILLESAGKANIEAVLRSARLFLVTHHFVEGQHFREVGKGDERYLLVFSTGVPSEIDPKVLILRDALIKRGIKIACPKLPRLPSLEPVER